MSRSPPHTTVVEIACDRGDAAHSVIWLSTVSDSPGLRTPSSPSHDRARQAIRCPERACPSRREPRTATPESAASARLAKACASGTDTERTACLAAGIAGGAMLSSSTPSPIRTAAASGSAAISPHTATRVVAPAASVIAAISRSTAGSSGSASRATAALPRSAARVYWVRSLVPMLNRSTSAAAARAWRASAGTSTMTPTSKPERELARAGNPRRLRRPRAAVWLPAARRWC